MANDSPITYERLRSILRYNADTGAWTWLPRLEKKTARFCKRWEGRDAGSLDDQGYLVIRADGQIYKSSRLAWLYMTGAWPVEEIDHWDRDHANNRWANLRPATRSQNEANKGAQSNNILGVRGVTLLPSGSFQARINKDGVLYNLGCFSSLDAAKLAYDRKSTELFGEFAGCLVDDRQRNNHQSP